MPKPGVMRTSFRALLIALVAGQEGNITPGLEGCEMQGGAPEWLSNIRTRFKDRHLAHPLPAAVLL